MAVKASYQITLADITDAYAVNLSSEAYTFTGNTSGAPSGLSCSTIVTAYCGSTVCSKVNVTVSCPTGISSTITNNNTVSPTITFKTTATVTTSCEATITVAVDDVTISKKFSFAIAKTGATGETGTGVSSITEEYYLSTSKTTQTGGSWTTTPPTWTSGKYLWTRTKIVYTNPPSTVYTTPICDTSWEAANDVAEDLENNYYTKTETDAQIQISGDSITSSVNESLVTVEENVKNAQDSANEASSKASSNESRITVSESTIKQLSDSISSLVTDENGESLMTQTSDGWTFNIGSISSSLNDAIKGLDELAKTSDEAKSAIENLESMADDLAEKTAYIIMATDDAGNPCIELGKEGNPFKVRITNTSVDFMDGTSKIAYVSNKTLYIEKAIIKDEIQIGEGIGFVWKRRSNGNMGLRWEGGE